MHSMSSQQEQELLQILVLVSFTSTVRGFQKISESCLLALCGVFSYSKNIIGPYYVDHATYLAF